ncbi:MAG: hypothetical protein HY231_23465 [Acidobacteria bacterium]|nr:hypothetical protein [Acidobacteriota bacterium]
MSAKSCTSCGYPLNLGLANCPNCGARVGTVFSETLRPVELPTKKRRADKAASPFYDLEKTRSRANNSLILALGSFICPGVGFLLAVAAIILGMKARQALIQAGVVEGQGTATAGLVIGGISVIAQISYIIYFMKAGFAF